MQQKVGITIAYRLKTVVVGSSVTRSGKFFALNQNYLAKHLTLCRVYLAKFWSDPSIAGISAAQIACLTS